MSDRTNCNLQHIDTVYSLPENKAIEASLLFRTRHNRKIRVLNNLAELDRSATGYLPQKEHDQTSRQAFLNPTKSVRGWERVDDLRRRVVRCYASIVASSGNDQVVLVSGHGGAGLVLYSHLLGRKNIVHLWQHRVWGVCLHIAHLPNDFSCRGRHWKKCLIVT